MHCLRLKGNLCQRFANKYHSLTLHNTLRISLKSSSCLIYVCERELQGFIAILIPLSFRKWEEEKPRGIASRIELQSTWQKVNFFNFLFFASHSFLKILPQFVNEWSPTIVGNVSELLWGWIEVIQFKHLNFQLYISDYRVRVGRIGGRIWIPCIFLFNLVYDPFIFGTFLVWPVLRGSPEMMIGARASVVCWHVPIPQILFPRFNLVPCF